MSLTRMKTKKTLFESPATVRYPLRAVQGLNKLFHALLLAYLYTAIEAVEIEGLWRSKD